MTLAELRSDKSLLTSDDRIPTNGLTAISLAEVSLHDDMNDCWIIIFDRVYDVTKLLNTHPGGAEVLLEYAGRDATFAFENIGHSKSTYGLLKQYEIGELPSHEQVYRSNKNFSSIFKLLF